jgi:hypothetical protein
MKNFHKTCLITLGIFTLLINNAFSQDSNTITLPTDGPKRLTFEGGMLFDQQTVQMQPAKSMEMIICHRFGSMENGVKDLYGIYGAANIAVGMNYNLTDRIQVGFTTVKFHKLQNFQYKVKLFNETKSGSIPVSIVWYGNAVIDGREKTTFGTDYKFSNRMSYFNELMIAKKFNEHFSLQIAPSFTHYNIVELGDSISVINGDTSRADIGYDHDKFGISILARYKFSPQMSFVVGYDMPFYIKAFSEHLDMKFKSKPNLTFGFEISTSTHTFHVFLATANGLLPQENMMWNSVDYNDMKFIVGFNLTRLWNF